MMKTVIFDLGGVVFDWNPKHLFRDYFGDESQMNAFLEEADFYNFNAQADAGSYAETLAKVTEKTPREMELFKSYGDNYLKSIRGQFQGTLDIIENLKARGVPVYALTNWATDTFAVTVEKYPNLMTMFIEILVSGEEGLIKPDPKIYELALNRWNLKAEETIFIDDSLKNIEGANALGIHGVHFTSPEKLERAIRNFSI